MKKKISFILLLLLCIIAILLFLVSEAAANNVEGNALECSVCSEIENTEEIKVDDTEPYDRERLKEYDYEEEIEEPKIDSNLYYVPENSGFKSYMSYRTITNTSSKQYKLQNEYAYTGNYGIRMADDRYCIALGSYFTHEIGQYVDLILENGTIIPCILAEAKADIHTDKYNIVTVHNGCVSEFVVDSNTLFNTAKITGDISNCSEEWDSPVSEVVVYDKNIFN